ncbi:phospholipase [Pseudomonas sp. NPDC089569]|uniref:phospholipase n=1 Tax=Pseudomonas sp. NPDC089569 TaxID=3390722 RepID=UPI003D09546E
MTDNAAGSLDKRTWMSKVLEIDTLKLTDIVWPGAHNAGMDKKGPDIGLVVGNWTACQNDSFSGQLANGARAFDVRLGYERKNNQDIFYFHHNGNRSGRELEELITAVIAFLDDYPDEFIVLDFHQLGDGGRAFDHKKLNDHLLRRFDRRVVPSDDVSCTIGELKQNSALRRIVLATGGSADYDQDQFWSRIPHRWHGKTFPHLDLIEQHIGKTLAEPPSAEFFWSLSATCYSLLGPENIKHMINAWFAPTLHWVTRCSIINTDFFDESKIVHYCWIANSMKAVYGHALHESTDLR